MKDIGLDKRIILKLILCKTTRTFYIVTNIPQQLQVAEAVSSKSRVCVEWEMGMENSL